MTPGLKQRNPYCMVAGRGMPWLGLGFLKVFKETPKEATKETVHLMNVLKFGVSTEDVGE